MIVEKINETCAQTAKRLRPHLREKFPGVKFYVRSETYAGGASIHVRWTDGPTERQVRDATHEFEGATFDGMIDLKSYKDDVLYATDDGSFVLINPGADYVLTHREVSQEWRSEIAAEIARVTGEECDLTCWSDLDEDGEPVKRNGAGWDSRYSATVHDGQVMASTFNVEYGRDLFYRASDKPRY